MLQSATGRFNRRTGGSEVRPLSAPWLVPGRDQGLEVRLLVAPDAGSGPEVDWRDPDDADARTLAPGAILPTPLGADIAVARFAAPPRSGSAAAYRVRCGTRATPWIRLPRPPEPGERWRFLIASDHQQRPGVRETLRAVADTLRDGPFHGLLCAGDLGDIPDDPRSWFGHPEGVSFFDTIAAPAWEIFLDEATESEASPFGWPLASSAPIVACAGNHDVTGSRGADPRERFERVAPDDWNARTFAALFLPEPEPLWVRTTVGPLEILALFVARRWARGDHETRTGPAYETPGQFIFAPFTPGSPQHEWLRRELETPARGLRVVLAHELPYARGHNARPPFSAPVAYRGDWLAEHLAPLLERGADLAIGGHNHAVDIRFVGGVPCVESSHLDGGYAPAQRPEAPEPLFFASETEASYFSVLEVPAVPGAARVRTFRIARGGGVEEAHALALAPRPAGLL
jgi:hypothetical protein